MHGDKIQVGISTLHFVDEEEGKADLVLEATEEDPMMDSGLVPFATFDAVISTDTKDDE